jgi:hypothetical protein
MALEGVEIEVDSSVVGAIIVAIKVSSKAEGDSIGLRVIR